MAAYETGRTAGDIAQLEGRRIYALESELTHPSHADGFVDANDPVLTAGITGVCLNSATAATDKVTVETEGIYHLSVVGAKATGNAAIAVMDPVYIDAAAATLSGDARDILFGVALGAVSSAATTVIPVLLLGKNRIDDIFAVTIPNIAAASIAKPLFIAPRACVLLGAYETHITVAGQAGTMTLEACAAGVAPGSGSVLLAAAWNLESTANTPVWKAGDPTVTEGVAANAVAAGSAVLAKVASGNSASYAGAAITMLLKWT